MIDEHQKRCYHRADFRAESPRKKEERGYEILSLAALCQKPDEGLNTKDNLCFAQKTDLCRAQRSSFYFWLNFLRTSQSVTRSGRTREA